MIQVPYITGLIEKFWFIVLTNKNASPNFSDLLNLAESIITIDNPENDKALEQITYIREYTHNEIKMASASFELWLSRNWQESINKEMEFKDGKEIKLYEVVRIVDNVIKDLCLTVSNVAKKYSIKIVYNDDQSLASTLNDPFANFGQQ